MKHFVPDKNGSRSSGDGSTIASVQEKPVYVSSTAAVNNGDLFDNSAHSHQLENAALQRLGALLSTSSSKSDTSSHIFCEKSDVDSEISSNLLTLEDTQQQQKLTAAAPIATAEESIKSSTAEEDVESTVSSWQPAVMTSHHQGGGGVKVSNLNNSPGAAMRERISSELEAAFCSLDQEMQHQQQEVQSGTEI